MVIHFILLFMQVGNSRVLDVEYINNIFACVSPTLKEHFKNGLQADFSTSACFVEGSLDEDRLRCTLLPDGIVGKIKCAFSFKNSGSPNHQFTCCDGLSIRFAAMAATSYEGARTHAAAQTHEDTRQTSRVTRHT